MTSTAGSGVSHTLSEHAAPSSTYSVTEAWDLAATAISSDGFRTFGGFKAQVHEGHVQEDWWATPLLAINVQHR